MTCCVRMVAGENPDSSQVTDLLSTEDAVLAALMDLLPHPGVASGKVEGSLEGPPSVCVLRPKPGVEGGVGVGGGNSHFRFLSVSDTQSHSHIQCQERLGNGVWPGAEEGGSMDLGGQPAATE